MTGALILVLFAVMDMKGLPTSFVAEMIYAIIILVSLLLSVLFLKDVKED
jgi:hypothetical protein